MTMTEKNVYLHHYREPNHHFTKSQIIAIYLSTVTSDNFLTALYLDANKDFNRTNKARKIKKPDKQVYTH